MRATLYRRLNVNTLLSSITILRSWGRINERGHQGSIDCSGTNFTYRGLIGYALGSRLNFNVCVQNHFIWGRRKQLLRRGSYSTRGLFLSHKGITSPLASSYVMPVKRASCRTIDIDDLYHHSGLFINDLSTRNCIIASDT